MYKEDLALNNLQWLICHKTQPNQIIYHCYFHDVSADMSSGLLQVLSNLGMELRTTSFIETTVVACSDSVSHKYT